MLYLACKNHILHTVAEVEVELTVLDLDAQGLAAYGYMVISDTEKAVLTAKGTIEWIPFADPVHLPYTKAELAAIEDHARYLNPCGVGYEHA